MKETMVLSISSQELLERFHTLAQKYFLLWMYVESEGLRTEAYTYVADNEGFSTPLDDCFLLSDESQRLPF